MTSNNTPIQVTYSDRQLRILIEEFIAMQRSKFTFKCVCSYILYRAMEEERTAGKGIYESDQLEQKDCERVSDILKKIIDEGRIVTNTNALEPVGDNTTFVKTKE